MSEPTFALARPLPAGFAWCSSCQAAKEAGHACYRPEPSGELDEQLVLDELAFLAACASSCRCCSSCAVVPCPGVTAGGFCDEACHCRQERADDEERFDAGWL